MCRTPSLPWSAPLAGLLLLLPATAPALASDLTRTFSDCKCSYTLPNKNWSWVETKAPGTLCMATNGRPGGQGIWVVLTCAPLAEPASLDEHFVQSFEAGYYLPGLQTKRDGRFLTAHGLDCYQTEGTIVDGRTRATRVFLGHGRSYHLGVIGGRDPIELHPEFNQIMDGFAFTEAPAAPAQAPAPAAPVAAPAKPTPEPEESEPPVAPASAPAVPAAARPRLFSRMGAVAAGALVVIGVVAVAGWMLRRRLRGAR